MRFLFGRGWVFQEEANGETDGGAGADTLVGADGNDTVGEGEDSLAGANGEDSVAGAAGAAKVDEPKDMKSAIDAALGYDKEAKEKAAKELAEKKKAEETALAAKTAGAWPNGAPKKNAKGEDLDQAGKVLKVSTKEKKLSELDLTPEQKKAMKPETAQRFGELFGQLKSVTTERDTLRAENRNMAVARESFFGALEEAQCTKDDLAAYLSFNSLIKTGRFEEALKELDTQRVAILKHLGREDGGVDLLAEFPDLAKDVEEERITRKHALELATGRRQAAARQRSEATGRQTQQAQREAQEAAKKEQDDALLTIGAWTKQVAGEDLDWNAKEGRLLDEIDGVIKEYPPKLWLPTLKRLYAGLSGVKKDPPLPGAGKVPLRPSGAKPGAPAPANMMEAISQGLGYGKAA